MTASKNTATAEKTITLSGGKIATIGEFKGRHIMAAKKLTDDPEKLILAMISLVVTIDGNAIVFEDLEEMNGFDVLALMNEFSGFIPEPAK